VNATHEEWRPVVGYEATHEVSSHGRVRTLGLVKRLSTGRVCHYKPRICKQNVKAHGHRSVRLYKSGSGSNKLVHRLVLEAFVGPCPEGMQGCHNDGDCTNNHVSNLRWDTPLENNLDKIRHGVHHYKNRSHCSRGHEYTPESTRVADMGDGKTTRQCRICDRERNQRYKAALKLKAV